MATAGHSQVHRPLYVAFDGPDGVGKSTLANLAHSRWALTGRGRVTLMAEPERTGPLWELIRDHRLNGQYPERCWLLVLAAASLAVQSRRGGVIDQIQTGVSVVTDRSFLSVLAHYWEVTDESLRRSLASMFAPPDLTFVMRPESAVLLERRLGLRGEDPRSIEESTCIAWRYGAAGNWLAQHGWPVSVLDVQDGISPARLWECALQSIARL